MQVKANETKQLEVTSGSYDGVNIDANLVHTTAETALLAADYNPSKVNVTVKLITADDGETTVMQTNLQLLGTEATLLQGHNEFLAGIDKVYPTTGKKANKLRTVKIPFGDIIRVEQGDSLIIEVTVQDSAFSANCDNAKTAIDFYATPAVGYGTGIPQIKTTVIQSASPDDSYSLGNNVTRISILNFDKNDLVDQVLTKVDLTSDRLDLSLTFDKLLALEVGNYSPMPNDRYGSTLPIPASGTTGRVFKGLKTLPQSFVIWNGIRIDNELDDCVLNLSFNGDQVAASQNYIVHRTYKTSLALVARAKARMEKHLDEKIAKTPTA